MIEINSDDWNRFVVPMAKLKSKWDKNMSDRPVLFGLTFNYAPNEKHVVVTMMNGRAAIESLVPVIHQVDESFNSDFEAKLLTKADYGVVQVSENEVKFGVSVIPKLTKESTLAKTCREFMDDFRKDYEACRNDPIGDKVTLNPQYLAEILGMQKIWGEKPMKLRFRKPCIMFRSDDGYVDGILMIYAEAKDR